MNIRALCRSAVVVLPLLVVAAASCKDDNSGALMLAMTTDLSVPDDVTAVGLQIESDGRPLVNLTQLVIKTSDGNIVRLPATFAVTPAEDPKANPKVRVRVVAYQGQVPIVLRQAISTVPRGRIGLLRMPLLFANKTTLTVASAVSPASHDGLSLRTRAEDLPSEISDKCGRDETLIDGVCKDANVDSSTLPTCASQTCDDLVFNAPSGEKKCMSIAACFLESPKVQSWKLPVVAAPTKDGDACTVALPEAYRQSREPRNFVLSVPDGTGTCANDKTVDGKRTRSDCYVPVRPSTAVGAEGYVAHDDGTYGMPNWVCTKLKEGRSVQVSTGCDAEFGPGIELCPLDRPADLTPIKFTKTDTGPFMADAGADAAPRKPGKSDGITFLPESIPEQLLVPEGDNNLYVLAQGQKLVRASIANIDCSADAGAPTMPTLTTYQGARPNHMVFEVPRSNRAKFSLLELPTSLTDPAGDIGLTRLRDDAMMNFGLDATLLVRGLGMTYSSFNALDYLFVVNQTPAGATTLLRKLHVDSNPFVTFPGSAMLVPSYGEFTGAVAGLNDAVFTAHKKMGVAGATLVRSSNASVCDDATTACFSNVGGTTVIESGSDPVITSIVIRDNLTPIFFTASTPGSGTSDIYMTPGTSATANIRIAKGLPLEERGAYFAPPQIVADAQCVYAIRKSAAVGDGQSTHEIICIEYKNSAANYPISVIAKANAARGLAAYQFNGRTSPIATVFWGEATPAGTFGGQVRCISRTVAGQ